MDEGLFAKHFSQIRKRKDSKEELVVYIQEHTGLLLEDSEISISKKEVTLHLSSVKKSHLIRKGITELFITKGYTVRM